MTLNKAERAFTPRKLNGMVRVIEAMGAEQRRLCQQSFTTEDLMQLFIPREHRQLLRDSYAMAPPEGFTFEFYAQQACDVAMLAGGPMKLRFTWDSRSQPRGFFPPKTLGASEGRAAFRIVDDCPPELAGRFRQTMTDITDVSYRFGMAVWMFKELNEVCKTVPQMRYYWEALLPVLRKAGENDLAEEVSEPSVRAGEKVTLPPHLLPFLKATSDTIARHALLDGEQIAAARKPAVSYTVEPPRFTTSGEATRFPGTT